MLVRSCLLAHVAVCACACSCVLTRAVVFPHAGTVIARRLHVGLHNGRTFVKAPKEVPLEGRRMGTCACSVRPCTFLCMCVCPVSEQVGLSRRSHLCPVQTSDHACMRALARDLGLRARVCCAAEARDASAGGYTAVGFAGVIDVNDIRCDPTAGARAQLGD